MGTISTGIGLVSGLDIRAIVDQLLEIESRPSTLLQQSIEENTAVQTAIQALSLSIASSKLAADRLGAGQSFVGRTAASSSDAIVATAGPGATIGSFSFAPKQLVSTHQVLSSGVASEFSTVGSGAISISQGGFVDQSTRLSLLNGGDGVQVGSIRIIDRAGNAANIDLAGALSVNDVVEAVNSSSGVAVSASVEGDRIKLTDLTGLGSGTLQVQQIGSASTAADLGLTGLTQNGDDFIGTDILDLASGLNLQLLNDGNGVRTVDGLNDIRITTDSGSFDVNLSNTETVDDVIQAIQSASAGSVSASVNGNRLVVTDEMAGANVTVTALNGSLAAFDLGIEGSVAGATLTGKNVLGGLDTVLLDSLNGGYAGGADALVSAGQVTVTGDGPATIDFSSATTLSEAIELINAETGTTGVSASVNAAGNGIDLAHSSGGSFTVVDDTGDLASFLNIAGSSTNGRIQSGGLSRKFINENTRLDTLNGGTGVPKGKIQIIDGFGKSGIVDLTQDDDTSIGEVISEINGVAAGQGLALTARINDSGDGILIEQTGGSANLQVLEVNNGTTADALNIAGVASGNQLDGSFTFEISVDAADTLEDVAQKIADSGAPVRVNIINDGSGLTPFRLSLVSKQSGLAGELLIDPGATSLSFVDVSRPHDAVILFGGGGSAVPIQITSNTNTFSGLVPGVDLDVQSTSATPVTVTVEEDEAGIVGAVQGFVDAFNAVKSFIDDTTGFDPDTEERGLLFTESSVRLTESILNRFVTSVAPDTGSSIGTIRELGVRLNSNGRLEFDQETFTDALQENPEDVERFFTAADSGFADAFAAVADRLIDDSGVLSNRADALGQTVERQDRNLDRLTERLDVREQQLLNQFFSLENALAQLNSQQSVLGQLASLAASFQGRSA